MTVLPQIRRDPVTRDDALFQATTAPTTIGRYLGESVRQGFQFSGVGAGLLGERIPPLTTTEGRAAGVSGIARTAEAMRLARRAEEPITEEEWGASPDFREDIPWQEGMTRPRARALAVEHDRNRWRDSLYERYQGGVGGRAAGIAAMLLGSAASPESFIPFLGPAARAAAIARFGTIAGRATIAGAEGVIGTAIADLAAVPVLRQIGEDIGIGDVALDLGFGALLGGAFGTVGGLVERRRQMTRAARVSTIHRVVDALNLAEDQMRRGEPVNVGPVVGEEVARLRAKATEAEASAARATESPVAGRTGETAEPVSTFEAYKASMKEGAIAGLRKQIDEYEQYAKGITPAGSDPKFYPNKEEASAFLEELRADLRNIDERMIADELVLRAAYETRPSALSPTPQSAITEKRAARQTTGATKAPVKLKWQHEKGTPAAQAEAPIDEQYSGRILKAGKEWTARVIPLPAGTAPPVLDRVVKTRTAAKRAVQQWADQHRQGTAQAVPDTQAARQAEIETTPEPHPSIATGESRVKPGGDELDEFAEDAGLEIGATEDLGPALAELEAMGIKVDRADAEALADADLTVKSAEGWAEAYERLLVCPAIRSPT